MRRSLGLLFAIVLLLVSSLIPPERERIALGGGIYGASANGRRLLIEVATWRSVWTGSRSSCPDPSTAVT